jgi:hypothetical protein
MGYEIEMSFDLRKHNDVTKLLGNAIELAEINNCERHFQFTETEGEVRRIKKQNYVLVFCFEDERFEGMTNFLKQILARYKRKIHIESIYEVNNHNLIYASSYYMSLMEKEQKEDYKYRREKRSYSETDYFILREILKKNY